MGEHASTWCQRHAIVSTAGVGPRALRSERGRGSALYSNMWRSRERKGARDGMLAFESAYHYVVVEVYRDFVRMCPKRTDGTALEACTEIR